LEKKLALWTAKEKQLYFLLSGMDQPINSLVYQNENEVEY